MKNIEYTYSKNLYYINAILGNSTRREKVVCKWLFYLTWFMWRIKLKPFIKFKGFNVLYQKKGG